MYYYYLPRPVYIKRRGGSDVRGFLFGVGILTFGGYFSVDTGRVWTVRDFGTTGSRGFIDSLFVEYILFCCIASNLI